MATYQIRIMCHGPNPFFKLWFRAIAFWIRQPKIKTLLGKN